MSTPNLQVVIQNPGCSQPLILPIEAVSNTPLEELHRNIRINSSRDAIWIRQRDPNSMVAMICGSGPSIKEDLAKIKELKHANLNGAYSDYVIFALNGCAKFLHDNGITPEYQIIVDAKEDTADLVGPANEHLFASQVHPKCFEKAPEARVWHLNIQGIDDCLDNESHLEETCLIQGEASVGNCALNLAYALGYRNFHLFGYDSSYKDGESHAFRQPMNDGEPCIYTKINEKDYLSSFTMKLQAERFMDIADELQKHGCNIKVHGSGLLPDMWNAK